VEFQSLDVHLPRSFSYLWLHVSTLNNTLPHIFRCCWNILVQNAIQSFPYEARRVESRLMLRPTVSRPVCLGIKHPSEAYDQIFITFRQLRVCWCGASLWWDGGFVAYICCCASPAQPFSGPSPVGLATIFYCPRFETSFSSPPTNHRVTVEVFDPASTHKKNDMRSGDRAGQVLGPPRPIQRPECNLLSGMHATIVLSDEQPSCWYHVHIRFLNGISSKRCSRMLSLGRRKRVLQHFNSLQQNEGPQYGLEWHHAILYVCKYNILHIKTTFVHFGPH
jgi:hypothetical protein